MKKRIFLCIMIMAVSILPVWFAMQNRVDCKDMVIRVASVQDISTGAFAEGAEKFTEKYGCRVEFTDDVEKCDLIYTNSRDFYGCQPLNKYVKKGDRRYSKKIIDKSCTRNGEIYGITNALLGNISYCVYVPEQYGEIKTPYNFFDKNKWNWESFIEMTKELNSNVSVNWNNSYINNRYALSTDENGNAVFDYGTQEQVEWLNFVRTLIYDEGIVNNEEGAFKVGFLPELAYDAINEGSNLRYIPLPTKNGLMDEVYVDEYHFCVPKTTDNVKAVLELANYMIDACVETRLNLYQSVMKKEDFQIFEKQLKKVYSYPEFYDFVDTQKFVDDFVHGKTVTEHIFNVVNDTNHIK